MRGPAQALEKLLALQQEHGLEPGPEDHFGYAQIWSEAGAPERAMEEAVRYLQIRGREAEHYEEALDLINRAEGEQARAESGAGAPSGAQAGLAGIRVGETVAFDGIEFVGIPSGEFLMGSTSERAYKSERPVARVRISKGFWMGKYEVTQDQWQAVMGNNPSDVSGCGTCPVESVSWEDVQEFIGKLNGRSGGGRYRLPTEAEWEYAARAGTTTDTYAGDVTNPLGNDPVVNGIAWYRENSGGRTHPAGQMEPNGFGLYDMLGNVWEWVGGLVRGLSRGGGDGPCRSWFGLEPGLSRWRLGHPRRVLPVGVSRGVLAGPPHQFPRVPPAEDGVTLGSFTLLPLAWRCRGGAAGKPRRRARQRPGRAGKRLPLRLPTAMEEPCGLVW